MQETKWRVDKTNRALVLNGFLPKSRGWKLGAQNCRTAEQKDLSGANHSTGRVI